MRILCKPSPANNKSFMYSYTYIQSYKKDRDTCNQNDALMIRVFELKTT